MLFCDSCNKRLESGFICTNCRRLLCKNCSTSNYCNCENATIELSVNQTQIKNFDVQWVVFQGRKRFGLAGFDSFPVLAYKLLDLLPLVSNAYEVILVNSRALSKKLSRKIGNDKTKMVKGHVITPMGPGSKNSRYSLIIDEAGKESIVFLDASKTRESAIRFLILYLNHFFSINSTISMFDPKKMSLVGASLGSSFARYNKKFGISFFSITDFFLDLARDFYIKFRTSYIEYLTLKELSVDKDCEGELSDFISAKIELLFTLTPPSDIRFFLDTINVWGMQTEGFTLVVGLSAKKPLYVLAKNKFKRENAQMLKRFAKHPDLVLALNEHASDLELQDEYDSFESYIEASCKRLDTFVGGLNPEYAWLEESVTIIKACKWYEEAIEKTRLVYNPQFGSVDDFIRFLTDTFYKGRNDRRIYPEISIIAGYGLVNFLHKLLLVDPCKEYLEKILAIAPDVSDFIVISHGEIKRKHPESRFLDYEVPALVLTGLIQVCINNQKFDLVESLLMKSEEFARKYDLAGILVQVYWTKFLFYQDYESLLKVYKLHLKIIYPDFVKENDFEVFSRKIQALLAAGVFEEKDKFKHYSDAIELSKDFPFSCEDVNEEDLLHQRMSHYIAQIFFFVEKALTQESLKAIEEELSQAKPYAVALDSELTVKTDVANILAWKTLLLLHLLKKEKSKINDVISKIEKIPFKSQTTEMFLTKAKKVAFYFNGIESSDPLSIMDLPIEGRDPWSRLLEKIVSLDFKVSVQDRMKFFSRAILLVEGPTEAKVFPIWAKTLGFDFKELGIVIVYLIGASKANFHLRLWDEIINSVKTVTNKKYLPIYMVLDLNAKSHGQEAISQGLVSESNCFILSMGDIEDYYPTDFLTKALEEMCGKKPLDEDLRNGRAHAIDHFLRKNGYHDDWKIPLSIKVANSTPAEQIPAEIQNIIKAIAQT